MILFFEQTAPTGSDCTAPYKVFTDRECTVEQFIDTVLTRGEWGKIYIKGTGWLEYERDKIITINIGFNLVLPRLIKCIRAAGGWSNMDYTIELRD